MNVSRSSSFEGSNSFRLGYADKELFDSFCKWSHDLQIKLLWKMEQRKETNNDFYRVIFIFMQNKSNRTDKKNSLKGMFKA